LVESVESSSEWHGPTTVHGYGGFYAYSEDEPNIWEVGATSQGSSTESYRFLSLPTRLVDDLKRLSKARGLTLTEFLRQVADRAAAGLPYGGTVEDDKDLSLKVEEVLARLEE